VREEVFRGVRAEVDGCESIRDVDVKNLDGTVQRWNETLLCLRGGRSPEKLREYAPRCLLVLRDSPNEGRENVVYVAGSFDATLEVHGRSRLLTSATRGVQDSSQCEEAGG
jgi:hypothetical protein